MLGVLGCYYYVPCISSTLMLISTLIAGELSQF